MRRVVRLLLRAIVKVLAVLAPFIIPKLLGFSIVERVPGFRATDPKLQEQIVEATLSILALGAMFAFDVVDLYIPREEARRFGKKYFQELVFPEFKELVEKSKLTIGVDVRINVMFAKRWGWLAYLVRRFEWLANEGFDPRDGHHHDAHMTLLACQRLAGRAFKKEENLRTDLRGVDMLKWSRSHGFLPGVKSWVRWVATCWLPFNEFHLWHRQLVACRHVCAILSVPIYREVTPRPNEKYRAVGVINVDAVSDAAAAWLLEEPTLKLITQYLRDHGAVIAYLG